MSIKISKAYRGGKHVGWKKTVGGREWFLGYGIDSKAEAHAKTLAGLLDAKWALAKAAGQPQLYQADFDDTKALLTQQPRPTVAGSHVLQSLPPTSSVGESIMLADAMPVHHPVSTLIQPTNGRADRSLYEAIDEFIITTRKLLKPDMSNGDHVIATIERISRARDAVKDMRLDELRAKEVDDWLIGLRHLPSKQTGRPMSPTTVRNLATAVKASLAKFAKWEWWHPPPDWREAFKDYTIKKLETPLDRKRRRKRPPIYSVAEKRVLWHLALPLVKAFIALADWAGHTQKEIATLAFDEIHEIDGEMIIARDRNKTGVSGRWWIPPEAAVFVRNAIAQTPRDPSINPYGLAFLTPENLPLVHRSVDGKHSRCDYVGHLWSGMLRISRPYDIQHISFKGLRKGSAQLIRDRCGKEVSRTFLAQADEDVQDEHYTRASLEKVEAALRQLYEQWKLTFEPIQASNWQDVRRQIRLERGLEATPTGEAA